MAGSTLMLKTGMTIPNEPTGALLSSIETKLLGDSLIRAFTI